MSRRLFGKASRSRLVEQARSQSARTAIVVESDGTTSPESVDSDEEREARHSHRGKKRRRRERDSSGKAHLLPGCKSPELEATGERHLNNHLVAGGNILAALRSPVPTGTRGGNAPSSSTNSGTR